MRLTIILILLSSSVAKSQNLVVNPGFEQHGIATDLNWLFGGDMFHSFQVEGWSPSTEGTTDYFLRNPDGSTNISLYAGAQSPANGNAFAGFIPWKKKNEYREYLTGTLSQPLEKGKKYVFRIRISSGNKNAYFVNDLGVFFSGEKIYEPDNNKALKHKPQIWLDATSLQSNPEQWIVLQNSFIANGDEKYFTIGNFFPDSITTVTSRITSVAPNDYAYYYADDIVVEPTTETAPAPGQPTALANEVRPGHTFVARGINFDFDKATLRPESYIQLHEIVAELKRKPEPHVEVRGHTDSSGIESHNRQLSKARAKAVADYLVSAGIEKSRITFAGYGSAAPVDVKNPAMNRRVEFLFQ